MNTTTKTRQQEAVQTLRQLLQPGDRVSIQVQSYTDHTRKVAVFFADQRGHILDLTPATARAIGKTTKTNAGRETFRIERDGRNAADHVARQLSKALFSDENAIQGELL